MIPTEDVRVVIEDLGPLWVVYRDVLSGERWRVMGRCTACGLCESGRNPDVYATGIPRGEPGAMLDRRFGERRDIPIRPWLVRQIPSCALRVETLDRG